MNNEHRQPVAAPDSPEGEEGAEKPVYVFDTHSMGVLERTDTAECSQDNHVFPEFELSASIDRLKCLCGEQTLQFQHTQSYDQI